MKCLALLVQYGGSLDKLSADHKESAIISAYKKQSTKALKFIRLLKDEALTKDGHDLLELEAGQKKQVRKSLLIGKRPVRKYALKTVLYFNSLRSGGLVGVERAIEQPTREGAKTDGQAAIGLKGKAPGLSRLGRHSSSRMTLFSVL